MRYCVRLAALALIALQPVRAQVPLADATIADIQSAMADRVLTAEKITSLYLARIEAFDKRGPAVNAVISLNQDALATARRLDAERRAGRVRGPLHGIPIVLKDNFDTHDLPTTAGCSVLQGSIPHDDAFVVKKLRDAGAVILAKVNMDEFAANGGAPNGYSSLGGQTRNPHDPTRSPGGSSGGTAVAVAAAFAQFGLGTDTSLSVRGPASFNGIVALRPTPGLVSRDGIVPLALSLDDVGPMARNVYDVAVALSVITGSDPADETTRVAQTRPETDYTSFLHPGALKGARIGVVRAFSGADTESDRVLATALGKLRDLGATLVDPIEIPAFVISAKSNLYMAIRTTEFAAQINGYLASLQPGYPRTLAELVARAEAMPEYANPSKLRSMKGDLVAPPIDDPIYLAAKEQGRSMLRAGIDALFAKHRLDAIVHATLPWPAGAVDAQPRKLSESLLDLTPQIGYPDLVVPAGMTSSGLPVTISFFGKPLSESQLLAYGYDFERATQARVMPKHTPALPGEMIGTRRKVRRWSAD